MAAPIRLLVVDDHPVVRGGLVALLGTVEDMKVVAEASDGREAFEQYGLHQPDVTLMDLRLTSVGGVEAIHLIRAEWPAARVIVLTTFDGDEDIYRAIQAGAKAYLLKGMSVEELIGTIRSVHQGRVRIPAAIAEKLAERMAGPQLTGRELEVLQLIVRGRSNKEIGRDLAISEATVKTHVNSLLGKLAVSDRTQASTAAIQRGIVHLDYLNQITSIRSETMPQTRDKISLQQGICGIRAGRMSRLGSMGVVLLWIGVAMAQSTAGSWRAANEKELKSLLPARATVEKEHIETEMRTASGITDARGKFIAGIVLITAGYSADGKYSHYLIVQAPMQVGQISLAPGEYVFGWQREGDALHVHFYDANTGAERGSVLAKRMEGNVGVESFKIWTPQTRSVIQLGRFGIPYQLGK